MILFNRNEVKFESFPNKETRMIKESIDDCQDNFSNTVSFKYENDSDLIKLYLLKKYLDEKQMDVDLIIYYMPYSRMDRSENGSPFTLKYISSFINDLSFKSIKVIEPHSDVTAALLNNTESIFINYVLLDSVLTEIEFDKEKDYLVFPDDGASKRYKNLKGFKQLVGFKKRDFETGEIKGLQIVGDVSSVKQKALIVDDLSSYGGTFLHSGRALKELGFEEIYLLVAHAENSIFKGELLKENSPINKVYTTDSILTEQGYWANQKYNNKIKIFNIEGVLNND